MLDGWTSFAWWQMASDVRPTEYLLRISIDGPSDTPFGWQIIRQHDSTELARSETTFSTRLEALVNSVRSAAAMLENSPFDG